MAAAYTAAEILEQLDGCARDFFFPMLDNGYVYYGTSRLTAYRTETHWALVIEVVGYNPRAGAHNGLYNCLYCFGNCLSRPPGTANEDFLVLTSDGPDGYTLQEEVSWNLEPDARFITLRDEVVPIHVTPEELAAQGIPLMEPPDVMGAELLRSLLLTHREQLLATEEELRLRIPSEVPQILRLDEWHHPDLCGNELPSASPTFQMLARLLVSGDLSAYQPAAPPNTHWRNWPESGSL